MAHLAEAIIVVAICAAVCLYNWIDVKADQTKSASQAARAAAAAASSAEANAQYDNLIRTLCMGGEAWACVQMKN